MLYFLFFFFCTKMFRCHLVQYVCTVRHKRRNDFENCGLRYHGSARSATGTATKSVALESFLNSQRNSAVRGAASEPVPEFYVT